MNTIKLDENFDVLYFAALQEQVDSDITDLLNESSNNEYYVQLIESLKILTEARHSTQGVDFVTGDFDNGGDDQDSDNDFGGVRNNNRNRNADNQNRFAARSGGNNRNRNQEVEDRMEKLGIRDIMDIYDKMNIRAHKGPSGSALPAYAPLPGVVSVEKIDQMKFPQNIIFFITQFLKWIKNNILNFIDKFSNIVRSLLGLQAGKSRFTEKDLKLNLEKAKKIESKYNVMGYVNTNAYMKDDRFSDSLNGTHSYAPNVKPVSLINVSDSDIRSFFNEGFNILDPYDEILTEAEFDKVETQVVRIDTSRDLFALKESLEYFFSLFDDAYGSNDERLFSVDDLELMLELFKNTLDSIKNPNTVLPIEVQGKLTFGGDAIDATRLRDNLLRTKINTDKLKEAYVVTNQQINNLSKIIMNKNMLGVSQLGAQYAFLSAATYELLLDMLNIIKERLKEASDMEKKLKKMKSSYESLVRVLEQKRSVLNGMNGMIYTTIIQRKVNDLYDGARYMSQTVQLRLNTLSLYISELNDTRAILTNLAAVPKANMNDIQKSMKKAGF